MPYFLLLQPGGLRCVAAPGRDAGSAAVGMLGSHGQKTNHHALCTYLPAHALYAVATGFKLIYNLLAANPAQNRDQVPWFHCQGGSKRCLHPITCDAQTAKPMQPTPLSSFTSSSPTVTRPYVLLACSYKVQVWVDKSKQAVRIDYRGGVDKTYFIGVSCL